MSWNYGTLGGQVYNKTVAINSNTNFFQPLHNPVVITQPDTNQRNIPKVPVAEPPAQSLSANPKTWGPHLWFYLHTMANNYPQHPDSNRKNRMKNWISSLGGTIPCNNCSMHFDKYISNANLDKVCASRTDLQNFLVDIHNIVNSRTGKPTLSRSEASNLYPSFRN
jgi:hypothetical protein